MNTESFCCADILCYFSPELLLSKDNAVDVIFCSLVLFVQPGLQLISDIVDEYIFFSQHSRKPHVSGSGFFGEFFI